MLEKPSLALALMVVGLGCGSAAPQPTTEGDRPKTFNAVTVDGTTNVGPSPVIQFAGQYVGGGLPAGDRATILAGLSLATWPGRTPVAADASLATAATAPGADHFTIAARGPLADGWYVGLAGAIPQDVLWTDSLDRDVEADGAIGVRVHVGSAPRLRRLDFCYKGADSTAVVMRFSEPISASPPADAFPAFVTAGGGCQALQLPTAALPQTDVEFVCAHTALADSFVVAVGDGLASPSGVAVQAFRMTVAPTSLPAFDATSCTGYKLDF